jgi:hypothetical protein
MGYSLETLLEGTLYHKILPDGRLVTVVSLLGRRARITIGPVDVFYEDGW